MLELIGRAQAAVNSGSFSNFNFITPNGNVRGMIVSVLNWFVALIGVLAVIYFVYGGVLYLTAGADAEKATKGRTVIVNAIIGIVIVVSAFVILNLVSSAIKAAG